MNSHELFYIRRRLIHVQSSSTITNNQHISGLVHDALSHFPLEHSLVTMLSMLCVRHFAAKLLRAKSVHL